MTPKTQIAFTTVLSALLLSSGAALAKPADTQSPEAASETEILNLELTPIDGSLPQTSEVVEFEEVELERVAPEADLGEAPEAGMVEENETYADDPEVREAEVGEAGVGEAEVGEAEASETEASETEADELAADELAADELDAEEIETGEADAPDVETGEVEALDVEANETDVLDIEATGTSEIEADALPPLDTDASDLGEPEMESPAAPPETELPEAELPEAELPEAGLPEDSAETMDDGSGLQGNDRPLQLKQSAKLSLEDALDIIEAVETEAAQQARSAVFVGDRDRPIIAVEVGMQAIAIDANDGGIVGVQNIGDIPDRNILAAAEAATNLKSFAKITLKQALQAAEQLTGEAPQQVALGVDEGSLVYRATIAQEQVFIDAGDAQVLYSSSDRFDAGEKPRGSIQIPEQP